MKTYFYITSCLLIWLSLPLLANNDQKKGTVPPSNITVSNAFLRDTTAFNAFVGIDNNNDNTGAEDIIPVELYTNELPRGVRPPIVIIETTPFALPQPKPTPDFILPSMPIIGSSTPQNDVPTSLPSPEMSQPNALLQVLVFPNPTADLLHISLPQGATNGYHLQLIATNGQVVEQRTEQGKTLRWSVQHLPNGVYYLHLSNGEQQHSQAIVVRH